MSPLWKEQQIQNKWNSKQGFPLCRKWNSSSPYHFHVSDTFAQLTFFFRPGNDILQRCKQTDSYISFGRQLLMAKWHSKYFNSCNEKPWYWDQLDASLLFTIAGGTILVLLYRPKFFSRLDQLENYIFEWFSFRLTSVSHLPLFQWTKASRKNQMVHFLNLKKVKKIHLWKNSFNFFGLFFS